MSATVTEPLVAEYSVWASVRRFIGDRKAVIFWLAVASLLGALSEAGILTITAQVATSLVTDARARQVHLAGLSIHTSVGTLLVIGAGLAVIRLILQFPIAYLPSVIAGNVQAEMRQRLFASFAAASWDLQSQDREGHFQELMTNQITQGSQGALQATGMIIALFTFLILSATAFALNIFAAVIVLAVSIGMFGALRPLNRLGMRLARKLSAAQLQYAGAVGEANSVAEETRVFGVADEQRTRIGGFIQTAYYYFVRTQMVGRISSGIYQSMIYVVLIVGLGVIYKAHVGGVTSLGAVVLLLIRASGYGQQVQSFYLNMRQSLPYLERVDAAADRYEESATSHGQTSLAPLADLAFDGVSYAYTTPAGMRQALHELSFEVSGGETIGVVGPSGAGKSTMVQVLLGLRTPQAGRYTINGIPAADYSREDWSRRVVYVSQQPRLIYGTVLENVRFFRDISREKVQEACEMARIHDEIMSWDEGYETIVGPRAAAVSGGQQQRICLARSLAADPEILVLDEPTSALDPRSEALIQESLQAIKHRLTLFIIAHRMSTLSICDRVMVVLDGHLDAFSPVEELKRDNSYYRMASSLSVGSGTLDEDGVSDPPGKLVPDGIAPRRALIVSHAAAAEVNQLQYSALAARGWEVHLVIPDRWRDGFDGHPVRTRIASDLAGRGRRLPVIGAGLPQRHVYRARLSSIIAQVSPHAAFVEEEPFSASAWQWSQSLSRAGIPFGVQHAETLERQLALPARFFRRVVLERARFVAARSSRAAELVDEVPAHFVPHPLPDWGTDVRDRRDGAPFTVGYAGRLVEEKGIRDLLAACALIDDAQLLIVGDGPLRGEVEAAAARTGRVELRVDIRHGEMPGVYERMDVLVLPSRTTPTWTEQFGRVLTEAMSLGVPVVGSSSGEIPWVIEITGGGVVFDEGDVPGLAAVLRELADHPERRRELANTGRASVAEAFTLDAVAAQMDTLLSEIALPDRPPPSTTA